MKLIEIAFKIIIFLFGLLMVYGILWMLFAFGTDTYDDVTGTEDGTELYWRTYKKY